MDGTVWIHLDVDAPNAIFGFDSGEVYADADVRCFSPQKKDERKKKKDCYDGHCPRLLTAGHRHKGPARNEQRPERKMNHDARWCVKSLNMFYDMNLGHFVSIRAALSSAMNASDSSTFFFSIA